MPRSVTPKLSRHKATGQGFVLLDGRFHYLGAWPAGRKAPPPPVQAAYDELIARWLAGGRQLPPPSPSVNEVLLAYHRWAEGYYAATAAGADHLRHLRDALRVVRELYGSTPASEFGPRRLRDVQRAFAAKGWGRSHVNGQVGRVRRCFKWAVAEELVPGSVFHALQAVDGVRRGDPGAKEPVPVRPVAAAIVDATLPFLPPAVRPVVELLRLTGARPSEIARMRGCDLTTRGEVWEYRPARHKTQHHGRERVVFLGPQAQELLRPWLAAAGGEYLFSPARAEAARNAERKGRRKSPLTPSQAKRCPKGNPKRAKRDRYDVTSYRNALYRGADRAFPPPAPLAKRPDETAAQWDARLTPVEREQLAAWRARHRWFPNQIRHTAATAIRREHGIEVARVVLGHARAATTEIYAEADRAKAAEVMAAMG